jgi:uncharacterized protein YcfL
MIKRFFPIFLIALLLTACQAEKAIMAVPNTQSARVVFGTGKPIWEVGQIKDLPAGLNWVGVSNKINPTEFTYKVDENDVAAKVFWLDSSIIQINVTNHPDRSLCFYTSDHYPNAWIVTDGILAQAWLKDQANEYAMLGFKGELKVYFIFQSNTIKVSFLPSK